MKQTGFYCFSSSWVTFNGLKQVLALPNTVWIVLLFQIYCPVIFTWVNIHCYLRALCWSKLSTLGRGNGDFLLSDTFEKKPEIGHWKIKDHPQTERFCDFQIMASFGSASPHHLFFSRMNKIWLNQTSVFTHTSNISLPANILPRRICRIGSQVCIGWGLQTAGMKLNKHKYHPSSVIKFWMLTFSAFSLDVPVVSEQRALCSEKYYWKCSRSSTLLVVPLNKLQIAVSWVCQLRHKKWLT